MVVVLTLADFLSKVFPEDLPSSLVNHKNLLCEVVQSGVPAVISGYVCSVRPLENYECAVSRNIMQCLIPIRLVGTFGVPKQCMV